MKNNSHVFQKYQNPKPKANSRKAKYALKKQLYKVTSHVPLEESLENKIIQHQDSTEFFDLFHDNFEVILPQTDPNADTKNQKKPMTVRERPCMKNKPGNNVKRTPRNSEKDKNEDKTKPKKQRSMSTSKKHAKESDKPTLKKTRSNSCRTICQKKNPVPFYLSIMPTIRI